MEDEVEHRCDKTLIVDEHGRQLGQLFAKTDELSEAATDTRRVLIGNGTRGLVGEVEDMGERVDLLERKAITEEALKGMLRAQGRLFVAGLGVVATVLGILQLVGPAIRNALGGGP